MNQKKIKKYSLYFWLPIAAALLILMGYLFGLTSANSAHQQNSQGFESSFMLTSDEPDWR